MRVAVLHPQTAFVRGGAETHAESLVKALKAAGHDADLVQIAGKWYPPSQLAHQMAVWRSFDITESNGLKVDAVIGLKFPAYLAQHERKVVWLIHQHRTAYELWDHADYADLKRQDDGDSPSRIASQLPPPSALARRGAGPSGACRSAASTRRGPRGDGSEPTRTRRAPPPV